MRNDEQKRLLAASGAALALLLLLAAPSVLASDDPPDLTAETAMKSETDDGIDDEEAEQAKARIRKSTDLP